jgi:hypothetical protein
VIAHSTEPYLYIQDIDQSPFNVGDPIKLEDFNIAQLKAANGAYGTPVKNDGEIKDLLDLTGGQPYLVRLALYNLAKPGTGLTMGRLKQTAAEERGPFGDHLRQILWRLQEKKELIPCVRQVMEKGRCEEEGYFLRLRSAGLVKGETRDRVRMRCRLYEDYLRKHLL